MAKIQLPVRIEEKELSELKQLAKLENRSLSNYVDTMIKNHIADRQKRSELKLLNIHSVIKDEGEPLRSCEICKHNKSKGVCIDCNDWKLFERNGL
jgi:hypothetical protein